MASLSSLFRNLVISSTRKPDVLSKSCSRSSPSFLIMNKQWIDCLSRPISLSACLYAEPLKKKKKMDPQIVRARELRKMRKIEKQIRRLEKHSRQLKPIDESVIPAQIVDDPQGRARPLPQLRSEDLEQRWLLQKEWSKYKFNQHSKEMRMIERLQSSQERALNELRKESEELYQEAIAFVPNLVPLEIKGPVETPPIPGYVAEEGDFIDISRKWE